MNLPICFVYRCYDASGALLYVGVAREVPRRMTLHRTNKRSAAWIDRVERVESVMYHNRIDALVAERHITADEKPLHATDTTSPSAIQSAIAGLRADVRFYTAFPGANRDGLMGAAMRALAESGYMGGDTVCPEPISAEWHAEQERRVIAAASADLPRIA